MTLDIGSKISVCLLTYNHVDVIGSTIESILDQTIEGYEVIVSDDCSTDGTWERILEIARDEPRIRPIRKPRNMGMPGNANFAVAQSNRPYIALLHHDDIYRSDLLEKWGNNLEHHPNAGFVYNLYDDGDADYTYGPRLGSECVDGRWFLEARLFSRWGCPVRGTALIRRSMWDRLSGMREQFGLVADVDLWMRLSRISQVGYVAEPLIRVRAMRPEYYPDIYTGKGWHWRRHVLVCEIYADNRLKTLALNTLSGRLRWWRFRLRLSTETAKWLAYGLVKKRYEIIRSSGESVTQYDLWPLRAFRRLLHLIFRRTESQEVREKQPARHEDQ